MFSAVLRRPRRPVVVTVAVLLVLCGPLAGCGNRVGPEPTDNSRTPTRTTRTPTRTPRTPTQTTRTPTRTPRTPTQTTRTPTRSAEIWEWALGRNVWDDPALADLASSLGTSGKTNISVRPYGYQLVLNSSGTVVAVVLYNDEAALGLPGTDSFFRSYPGALPARLSWQDTYRSVVQRYGTGGFVIGGNGAEYEFDYQTTDGRRIGVSYLARHQSELPDSPIHSISVR